MHRCLLKTLYLVSAGHKGEWLMKFSDFTKPELEKIILNANFTDDEERIFNLLSRGFSVLEVSQKSGMSESSVYRRIRIIKVKVEKVRFL